MVGLAFDRGQLLGVGRVGRFSIDAHRGELRTGGWCSLVNLRLLGDTLVLVLLVPVINRRQLLVLFIFDGWQGDLDVDVIDAHPRLLRLL